jgi:hypothetical protein
MKPVNRDRTGGIGTARKPLKLHAMSFYRLVYTERVGGSNPSPPTLPILSSPAIRRSRKPRCSPHPAKSRKRTSSCGSWATAEGLRSLVFRNLRRSRASRGTLDWIARSAGDFEAGALISNVAYFGYRAGHCIPAASANPAGLPARVLKLLSTLKRNPLECWSADFFREPIVRVKLPFADALLVHDPVAIKHVLVDNAASYRKDPIQRRILATGLADGLLSVEGEERWGCSVERWRRYLLAEPSPR